MDNPFHKLLQNIINYFAQAQAGNEEENYRKFSTLIRIHNEKLLQFGDISFPNKPEIWFNYLPSNRLLNESAFKISCAENNADEEKQKFLDAAKEWPFPVAKLEVRLERIHLYLGRHTIMQSLIKESITNEAYGHLKKGNKLVHLQNLSLAGAREQDLSFYRAKLVHQVLQKLLKYSRYENVEHKPDKLGQESVIELQVESVASKCAQTTDNKVVKCGLVTDPNIKGKLCQLPVKDYLSIRSNDMTLMALHKYGVRAKQDARFCALMDRLGVAAVTVDLLEVKHTSPVQVIRNGQGSTKGASFILYNSARLETILRTFHTLVDDGQYDPLIPIESIQWNLLNKEEEWQLVYAYIAGFPNLIERCTEQIESGLCATHLIIHFLHGLVATFSIYYRRIKILTDNREQLMPSVYARIYLIKAVREILNKSLALLNIQPVDFM